VTVSEGAANEGPAIVGHGVYRPPFSAGTGRRRVTVRNGDEDAVTLAVEAARDLFARYDRLRVEQLDGVALAVGRPDLLDGPQPEMIREALGMAADVPVTTSAGDALAGLAALRAATDAVATGRSRAVLVLAAEPGDGARVSAGAVALVVTPGNGTPSIRLLGQHGRGDVVYGNWADRDGTRHLGDGRYLELRVADSAAHAWRAVTGVNATADGTTADGTTADGTTADGTTADGTTGGTTDGPDPDRGPDAVTGVAAVAAARACGAGPAAVLPDHGVAGPLLALLRAVDTCGGAGRTVHMLATTAARVVAVVAHADAGAPSWRPSEVSGDDPPVPPTEPESSPPLSLPTSSPFFRRAARELLRLEGARCTGCGHVVFPPSQRPVCPGCGSFEFEPAPLSRTGSVYSYVVNRFLPQGFGDEMALVLGEMDDGSRYWAPTSGMDTSGLAIGDPVELRLRRFTDHGGAPAYAMKFVAREVSA